MPAKVTTGSSALRSTWRRSTPPSGTPLARAVVTKSCDADLEHRRARQARVDRHVEQAERQRRQHQVRAMSSTAATPVRSAPTVLMPKLGSQSEPHAEHQHQHQPDPEQRRRVEAERQHGDDAVGERADAACGQRAERDAADDGEHERRAGQQQRRRQPFQDQAQHRPLLAVAKCRDRPVPRGSRRARAASTAAGRGRTARAAARGTADRRRPLRRR